MRTAVVGGFVSKGRFIMSNRTLGDDIEDHYWGTQGVQTGGLANQTGFDEHQRKLANSNSNSAIYSPPPSKSYNIIPVSFEQVTANLIGWTIWGGVSYYGISALLLAWYWPVGIGLVLSIAVNKLLLGPLYPVLTFVKWTFYSALIIGVVYILIKINGS